MPRLPRNSSPTFSRMAQWFRSHRARLTSNHTSRHPPNPHGTAQTARLGIQTFKDRWRSLVGLGASFLLARTEVKTATLHCPVSTDQRMPSENTARWGRRQSRPASGGADGFAVFGQFGNLGAKKAPTGAEQPFGTIVDGHAPGEAPQPLTLNHPASNPGCSLAVGVHSFEGTTAVVDLRQAKNEFNRPPSSGLRTCTIRDEHSIVPSSGD